MSIATRITSMEGHIEQAYDELQGLGADLTNVNKNIENISMVLDDIYDSMPQVSGEGTNLTLEDTRVGKIKSTLKGNTSQDGTPTPTSPIPVNVVSGDNTINVEGKNLFDGTGWRLVQSDSGFPTPSTGATIISSDKNNISFTSTQWAYAGVESGFIKVKANETYMLSAKFTTPTNRFFITQYDENKTRISTLNYTNVVTLQNTSFTTTNNGYIAVAFTNTTTAQTTYKIEDIQMEKGSTATTYEAYIGSSYPLYLGVENLFDKDNPNVLNAYISASGVISANSTDRVIWLPIKANTDYTFQMTQKALPTATSQDDMRIALFSTQPIIGATGTIEYSATRTSATSDYYLERTFNSGNNTYAAIKILNTQKSSYDDTIATIQLTKGSTPNHISTTPIELCKIGNYQDYFGKSDGRNLFDKDNATILYAYISTNLSVITANANNRMTYMKCKPNTTYTVSKLLGKIFAVAYTTTTPDIGVEFYGIVTGGTGDGDGTTRSKATITTGANASYLVIRYTNVTQDTTITETEMLNSIQIEESSTASLWQPYGVGKWYLHKEIGKVVLNGSETWLKGSTRPFYQIDVNDILVNPSGTTVGQIISNYFQPVSPDDIWTKNENGITNKSDSQRIQIRIQDDTYTLETFKIWLSNNNVVVYYVLATPTTTQITDTNLINQLNELEKAMSKDGQTNISQVNNDLPFIISASALKEWQESTSLNSTLSMVNPLSLGNTLNTQENNTQPIEVDNIEPLEEEENEES